VIGPLLSIVSGSALFGVALKRKLFMRVMGPTLSAQDRFQRRLPNLIEYSEKSHIDTARVIAMILGALFVVVGIVSLDMAAR